MVSPDTPVFFPNQNNQAFPGINPIKRKKIHTMILQELVHFIRSQNLQSGDQFPPERKLAEMMGVSRNVIREASTILQWLGVVESRQGSGIKFKKLLDGDLISPTSILLFSEQEGLLELFEVCILLEKEGAALAAKRRTQEDLAEMILASHNLGHCRAGQTVGGDQNQTSAKASPRSQCGQTRRLH